MKFFITVHCLFVQSAAKSKKKGSATNTGKRKHTGGLIHANAEKCSFEEFSSPDIQCTTLFTIPSTSNNDPCYSLTSFTESSSGSKITDIKSLDGRKSTMKSKIKSGMKGARRIIPPKTCKLVQEPPGAKPTTLTVQMNSAKKLMKSSMSVSNNSGCNTPVGDKKSPSAAYITKSECSLPYCQFT